MSDSNEDRATKAFWAGVYGRGAATYQRVKSFSYWGQRLVELTNIAQGAAVLDAATGRGAILSPATETVGPQGHVIGIDLAGGMVRQTAGELSERGPANVGVCQMDTECLGFRDASFDVVLCGFGLYFFPQVRHVFAEFARILKSGGRLGVSGPAPLTKPKAGGATPSIWDYFELLDAYERDSPGPGTRPSGEREAYQRAQGLSWPDRQAMGALSWPSPTDLESLLHQTGFADIQFIREETEVIAADEEEWWTWQWSHMPRSRLELLEPEILERFKADVLERLRSPKKPDGIHVRQGALLTLAAKSRDQSTERS